MVAIAIPPRLPRPSVVYGRSRWEEIEWTRIELSRLLLERHRLEARLRDAEARDRSETHPFIVIPIQTRDVERRIRALTEEIMLSVRRIGEWRAVGVQTARHLQDDAAPGVLHIWGCGLEPGAAPLHCRTSTFIDRIVRVVARPPLGRLWDQALGKLPTLR